jgi:hypothetical protein
MAIDTIYSVEFSNNYYINPLRIQTLYEEILTEFCNNYKLMRIESKKNSMVFYTKEDDVANKELETFPYDKGIIIQFFKEK